MPDSSDATTTVFEPQPNGQHKSTQLAQLIAQRILRQMRSAVWSLRVDVGGRHTVQQRSTH
jgi:hypothetical protein